MISERIQSLSELRRLLAEKFPQQRRFSSRPATSTSAAAWPTGIRQLDSLLKGGLPNSAITEVVASGPAAGSSLLMRRLMEQVLASGHWLALVDGHDSFDPATLAEPLLASLLWIRCREATEAIRAADMLLRDDNVPLAILDLRLAPAKQLRRIPSSAWYRLQRLLKRRTCACLVITPFPLVASAQFRVALQSRFHLAALDRSVEELVPELKFEVIRAHGTEDAAHPVAAEVN